MAIRLIFTFFSISKLLPCTALTKLFLQDNVIVNTLSLDIKESSYEGSACLLACDKKIQHYSVLELSRIEETIQI